MQPSIKFLPVILSFILLAGCQIDEKPNEKEGVVQSNPAAEGFNAAASDEKAVAIADSVMNAMGGRKQWDDTNVIRWNFFGRRTHTWDKNRAKDRIEIPEDSLIIQLDLNTKEGTVTKNGEEITQPDSVQKYLQQGYSMWVNDSYWLVMPYKLKDSGVTLNYLGTDTTQTGQSSHKLQLTFEETGLTPENMYHVYVDTADYLVRQWAYFPDADANEPQFVLPWNDYQQYNGILLSGNRGQYNLTGIEVMQQWPYAE